MLVGRGTETAVIGGLLDGARDGRSGVLVVRGEAGVGKSALLEHAAASADGFTVLRGLGVDGESELAYAALHQILRPVFDRIEQLPEPQAAALNSAFALSSETVDERFRVSLGVLGLLSEVAEDAPVLCIVDDAQWLDQASADALMFACRRLEAEPVAVLFGARDDDERPFVAHGIEELRLSGLAPSDSRQLLAERLGATAGAGVVEWLLENANGNPLALMELPGNLTAHQLTGQTPMAGQLPPATSVEHVYLERVGGLTDSCQNLLVLAACEETGTRATVERAARELGLDMSDLASAEAAGLLQIDAEQIRFRHPLVRTAIYRAAGFTQREAAHRTLAVASAEERNADRAAWHRAAATVGTDEEVAQELEETAERARLRSGHTAAASALERAAALSADSESRGRRRVAAAGAAWAAGQPERATVLLDQAAPDLDDPRLEAESDAIRGAVGWRCGSLTDGYRILMVGAAKIAESDPHRALEMLADAAVATWDAGDFETMRDIGESVTALPRSDGEQHALLAEVLVGSIALSLGVRPQNPADLLAALHRSAGQDSSRLLVWAAIGAELMGEHEIEASLLEQSSALARRSAAVDLLTVMLESLAVQGFVAGKFTVASEATEGLRLAKEAGLSNAANLFRATLAWLAAVQGRDDECQTLAQHVIEEARPRGHGIANSISEWAVGLLDLGRGRPEGTIAQLSSLANAPPGISHPFYIIDSAPDLVEACVRAGRREEAAQAFGVLEDFAEHDGPIWAMAIAARCRALLTEGAAAEGDFKLALDMHDNDGNPFARARTRLLYGEFLRRERRRSDAREQLREALSGFEALRAEPWAERARTELRATGETARKRDPGTAEELTPQELQIARLVAEGSSNKEVAAHLFLSPRTVEYHLRKVFAKLGISSRAELIRDGVGSLATASA
jgi:DNA-binding CsgD family transcriptional regulator